MKKVGIATVYTGYNYGSALQAFATKSILTKLGWEGELLHLRGSIVPGRDVRLKKLCIIGVRAIFRPGELKRSVSVYQSSITNEISSASVELFSEFTKQKLQPRLLRWGELKRLAQSEEYAAFLCGSDQIWNSGTYYVDPFYYLRFVPREKRIAYAPSFGRDYVPKYNEKKIGKYVAGIPSLSVRENSGSAIIEQLCHRKAIVLPDPTLVLAKEDWISLLRLNEVPEKLPYLLAYFLDEPSEQDWRAVEQIAEENELWILCIPYPFKDKKAAIVPTGPREFLQLVKNANFICTDSFHGTAFSLNFGIPFYTFERNYGSAEKQSARILSLLEQTGTMDRFCPMQLSGDAMDFSQVNAVLNQEREKTLSYLKNALQEVAQ